MSTKFFELLPRHLEKRKSLGELAVKLNRTSTHCSIDSVHLKNELIHLHSLKEEVATAVNMLVEMDDYMVASKIEAIKITEEHGILAGIKADLNPRAAEKWTRMSLNWKIFLYSIRCFQDSIYKSILIASGEEVGRKASMSSCIESKNKWRDNSGVGKIIIDHLPEYPDWFIRTRDLRNELKKGLSVRSEWKSGEHFIVLKDEVWEGVYISAQKEYPLKLEFALESIQMCLDSMGLIRYAYDATQRRKKERAQRMADEFGHGKVNKEPNDRS